MQESVQHFESTSRCAAGGADNFGGVTAEFNTFLFLVEQVKEFVGELVGANHVNGASTREEFDDLAEVVHVGADDDRRGVMRGFEDVMTAARNEAPADKSDRRELIDGREFADGVEEQDATGERFERLPIGALLPGKMGITQQVGDLRPALRMAWGKNHDAVRKPLLCATESLDHDRLFAFDGAAANDDGSGAVALKDDLEMTYERRGASGHDIELQIAANGNAIGCSADFHETSAIDGSLGEKTIHVLEHGSQQAFEAAVARERTIGDASINDDDTCATLASDAQKVRPELGFGDNDELGLQRLEVWANREGEIKGEEEDGVSAEAFAGELLSAGGSGGDQDAVQWILFAQAADESTDGEHFADRDGVHPDDRTLVLLDAIGDASEALGESGAILAVAQHLQQPPRSGDDERERQQRTVEEVHERRGIVVQLSAISGQHSVPGADVLEEPVGVRGERER